MKSVAKPIPNPKDDEMEQARPSKRMKIDHSEQVNQLFAG